MLHLSSLIQFNFRLTMGKSKKQIKEKIPVSGICEYLKNAGKTFLLLILLPPMLNYGGLKKEREYFQSNAILFDIGFGQQLYMNCTGVGTPTVILDAPTGIYINIHLSYQCFSSQPYLLLQRTNGAIDDLKKLYTFVYFKSNKLQYRFVCQGNCS